MPNTLRHPRVTGALASALLCCLVLSCGDSPPPTRRIGGARTVTFWSDQGRSAPQATSDTRAATVVARSLDGKTAVTAAFDARGTFQIDGAPTGPYLLEFNPGSGGERHFYRTEAAEIDLGGDILGRSDLQVPTQPTQVTFELSGLAATDPQDLVEITSSNASIWERLAPQGTLAGGVTTVSLPFAWAARPTPLLSAASGDILYVHQLSTRVDPGTGLSYQAAQTWAQIDMSVTDGVSQTISLPLAPVSSTGRLTVSWRPTQFEAALTDWPPNTQVIQHSLFIEGIAGQLDLGPGPRSGNPDLLEILAQPGTPDAMLDLPYGRFLPALWEERLQAYVTVRLRFPYLSGTIYYGVRIAMQASLDALPSELAPTLRPPKSVLIGNANAYQVRSSVGTGPLLAWTAPSEGTPAYYVVEVIELAINGTQVSFVPVASFYTTETLAQFPAGTLTSGKQYVAYLTAVREPTGHFATAPAPYRRHFPQDFAQTATAPFSP